MSTTPDIIRLRVAPVKSAPEAIDEQAGIIRGASIMQAVEALGHDMMVDGVALARVAELGNAAPNGIKVRFGHPGACDNALGKKVGSARNFRVVGDKVLADIHLSDNARNSPNGDLRTWILKEAKDSPQDFGMSVVIKARRAWKLDNGSEVLTRERPANAVGKLPFARVQELKAADFVDEPAANRDGLFSDADLVAAFSGTTNEDAQDAFDALDDLRARLGLSVIDVGRFAQRYLGARLSTLVDQPTPSEITMKLSAPRLAALKSEFPDQTALIIDLAVADKDEGEIRSELAKANLAALGAKVTALEGKVAAGDAALAAEKAEHDKTKAKLAALEKLGAPKDPGGSPTDTDPEAVLKAEWDGFDADKRKGFGSDFTIFRAWAINERPKAKA